VSRKTEQKLNLLKLAIFMTC